MRLPTTSRTVIPSHRIVGSLALVLAVALAGCPSGRKKPAPVQTVRLVNRAPVIQRVVITADGKRLRAARTGARMELQVFATDPDGDRLRYWFVSEPDGAAATATGPARARWAPPAGNAPARMRIRVADSRDRAVEVVLVAESEPKLMIGGQVVDPAGRAIGGVNVSVDNVTARTDAAGRFTVALPDRSQRKFVLNFSHPGYGPASFILAEPVRSGRWTLAAATVVAVNLQQPVTAQVPTGSCALNPSSRVNWAAYPKQHAAVSVSGTVPVTTTLSAELAAALQWAETRTECPAGFSVRAGANAFVRAGGGAPVTSGQIALTQIPAWGGASMPGDYTVRLANGETRAMQSFGAATVRVMSDGEPLQLARGQHATLRWPVDPLSVPKGTKPLAEIPLLRYDEQTGEWKENGMARLDSTGMAWIVEVDHFTAFNLDLLKVDQSCVRIDATAMVHGTFDLEIIIPQATGAVVRTVTIDNSTEHLHALYNLPNNVWIALRPFVNVTGTPEPHGTFLVNTGAPQVPTDPNQPDAVDGYAACQGSITLTDIAPTVTLSASDNLPAQSAMLVPVYAGLVERVSDDLYPLGSTSGFPVVGIFDNGSTSVYVSSATPNLFSGSTTSDATQLGATHGASVELRVSPMQSSTTVANAPMGGPLGPGAPADASLWPVLINTTTSDVPSVTQVGAPFAVKHVAVIDYTVGVPITGSTAGELGAWSTFFAAGEPGVPVPTVTLPMSKFGTPATSPYTTERRFLITGVTLFHTKNGVGRSVGHAVPGSTDQVWYNSGARWTAISTSWASALGFTPADGLGACYAAGTLYKVDRVEFVGAGGRYVVTDAIVCADDASLPVANGNPTQAMIGANLFRSAQLVVDGANDTFGIIKP